MNTALLLAATAPLNFRKEELERVNGQAVGRIDFLDEEIETIEANLMMARNDRTHMLEIIERNKSEISEIDALVAKINAEEPEKKGYAPGSISKVEQTQSLTAFWDLMTTRAACRTWFIRNQNKPITSRDLASQIGKKKGTVAATLSNNPEFICLGDTNWQLSSSFYTSGHVTVGR